MEADDQILFELPIEMELRKSSSGDRRILRGYASTSAVDADGETILQNGIDFSPLMRSGYINYDHQSKCLSCGQVSASPRCSCGTAGAKMPIIIGYPTMAEIREKGLWLESELLNSSDMGGVTSDQIRIADEMWALGMALKKSGGSRKLAYSVEGGVLERHGKKVRRSVVRHAALTHKPVNEEATVELFQKSICCGKCSPDHPLYIPGHSCGAHGAAALQKAMSTETGTPTANGNSPLMLQNLDPRMTSVLYGDGISVGTCDCCEPGGRFKGGLIGAVEHLKKCKGISQDDSINFLRKIIHNAPNQLGLAALVKQAGLTGN